MSEINIEGHSAKFLRVDLTDERITDSIFNDKIMRKFVGGTGIGAKILYDEVDPRADWSDPQNRLIFAAGPLNGTRIGGSGSFSLVTKGALTNGATGVQANGVFGAYLKFLGYDGIIVQGAARRWLYLHLDHDGAVLNEASHLLGKDTYEIGDAIRQELEKEERQMSVVSIGPAGEHCVRFAGVFADKGHAAAHNGPGAVMGKKKLKAIAVSKGGVRVLVKNQDRLAEIAKELFENARSFQGTIPLLYSLHSRNTWLLPVKNYTTSIWKIPEDSADRFRAEYIRKHCAPRPHPCWACQLGATHSTMMRINEGAYAGTIVEEPEYEQMASWGPAIDNKDAVSAIMLSGLTDRLGLENNEAGWVVAWVMECSEKRLMNENLMDGLKIGWGNVNATKELLHIIAHRRGVGDLLAEGVMRASQKIGGEAAKLAIYTMKGNTPRAHDHRSRWSEMFDTCVSNTGTIETHFSLFPPEFQGSSHSLEVSTYTALTKGIMVFEDSLVTCRFNTNMNLVLLSEAVNAVTGWDLTADEAKNVGLRAVNLLKAFNIRCGITMESDFPSERYGSAPSDGRYAGIGIARRWKKMLENYYEHMGWDKKTGKPLPATLRNLGLDGVIEDLWSRE